MPGFYSFDERKEMNIDDYRKRLSYLSFAILGIELIDILIILFTPMKESLPSVGVYIVLFNVALVFFFWIIVTDVQWRFAMLFVGAATAMEYFSKLAGIKNPVEAKFIAALAVLLLVFTAVSLRRFRHAPYYRVLNDEKGYMWLKRAVASQAVLFVVANFLGI